MPAGFGIGFEQALVPPSSAGASDPPPSLLPVSAPASFEPPAPPEPPLPAVPPLPPAPPAPPVEPPAPPVEPPVDTPPEPPPVVDVELPPPPAVVVELVLPPWPLVVVAGPVPLESSELHAWMPAMPARMRVVRVAPWSDRRAVRFNIVYL